MYELKIADSEFYDERTEEFVLVKGKTLQLEHSLVSISKWESKWHRAFLSDKQMTMEELRDYIRCMTITQNVDPTLYLAVNNTQIKEIMDYINTPQTATHVNRLTDNKQQRSKDVVTSELIYYWMVSLEIDIKCEKWHLSRLLALIDICNAKNSPPKKMNKRDILSRNAAINAARRKATGSTG